MVVLVQCSWAVLLIQDLEDMLLFNGTMHSAVNQNILKENVRSSVSDRKLKLILVLQQDNILKNG